MTYMAAHLADVVRIFCSKGFPDKKTAQCGENSTAGSFWSFAASTNMSGDPPPEMCLPCGQKEGDVDKDRFIERTLHRHVIMSLQLSQVSGKKLSS